MLRAYAAVTGVSPGRMAGMQVLVDGEGWLRAVQRPGAGPSWDDPSALAAAVRDLQAHPLGLALHSHAGMQM